MRFALILSFVIGALVLVFTLQNTDPTTVQIGPYEVYSPLAVVILSTFVLGMALGWLVTLPGRLRLRQRLRTLEKQGGAGQIVAGGPTASTTPSEAAETQALADEVARRTAAITDTPPPPPSRT